MTIDPNLLHVSPVDKDFYDNIYKSPNGTVASFDSEEAFNKLNVNSWRIINNMTSDIIIRLNAFTDESGFSKYEEEKIKLAICHTIDWQNQYDFYGNERKEKMSSSDNQGSFDMDPQNIDTDKTWMYLPKIAIDYLVQAGVFERLENSDYIPNFDIDSYVKFSQLFDNIVQLTATLPGLPEVDNPTVKDALEYLYRLIYELSTGVANTYLVPTVDDEESFYHEVNLPDGTTKPQNTINKENATLLNLMNDAIKTLQSAAGFDPLPYYAKLIQTLSLTKDWQLVFLSTEKLQDGSYKKNTYNQFHLIADIHDGNGPQDYKSFQDLVDAGGTFNDIKDTYFETVQEVLEWRITISAFGSGTKNLPVQIKAEATKPDGTIEELVMDESSGKKGELTFNFISSNPQDHVRFPIGTKIRWYMQVEPTFGGGFTFDITKFETLESVVKTNVPFMNVKDENGNLVPSKDVMSFDGVRNSIKNQKDVQSITLKNGDSEWVISSDKTGVNDNVLMLYDKNRGGFGYLRRFSLVYAENGDAYIAGPDSTVVQSNYSLTTKKYVDDKDKFTLLASIANPASDTDYTLNESIENFKEIVCIGKNNSSEWRIETLYTDIFGPSELITLHNSSTSGQAKVLTGWLNNDVFSSRYSEFVYHIKIYGKGRKNTTLRDNFKDKLKDKINKEKKNG